MIDKQLEKKIRSDAAKVKKDFNVMVGDSVSQLTEGFDKLSDDARETMIGAATALKKDVGHGLSQYNAQAQKVANRVPGEIGKKAASYPWVAISFALAVGFVLGVSIKPGRS